MEQSMIERESIPEFCLPQPGEPNYCPDSLHHMHVWLLPSWARWDAREAARDDTCRCSYCKISYRETHPQAVEFLENKGRNDPTNKKGGRRRMPNTDGKITVKEVASKAGVEPRVLRRLLRKSFGGGSRKTYVWEPSDPQIDKIVKAVQASKEKPAEKPAEKVTKTQPASKKVARGQKPAEKTAGNVPPGAVEGEVDLTGELITETETGES